MSQPISYEEALTAEVLDAVRPYANKLAKRTHGGLDGDDLLMTAVETILRRKRVPVEDMSKLLTFRVRAAYLKWVHGTNWNKETSGLSTEARQQMEENAACLEEANGIIWSDQEKYMSTGGLPAHDGVKELTVPNPVKSWELPLDVARALRTLTAKEQQFVRYMYWEELTDKEIAVKMGWVNVRTVERWRLQVRPKLRVISNVSNFFQMRHDVGVQTVHLHHVRSPRLLPVSIFSITSA